jgi:predicted Rossmann fold nucleotide-binding protein DprA/Smf involved in DNA uptake
MITPLTPNTQAILLLTAPLMAGRSNPHLDLLTLSEYNRLARMLREKQKQPADLIGADAVQAVEMASAVFGRPRLESLLGRGFLLSQAVERWNARSIWVVSRADGAYSRRIKARLKEDTPPLLYGSGDLGLLELGGLAIVGSRHVDEELIRYTENVGRLAAEARRAVVSGGAKGIDRAAMQGALEAGGVVVGVMADSLERGALARENREALMDRKLVLVSPYDPAAGFNVGHAMQRNKIIYALADAALVVTSDFKKGGTWAGAIEQLERLHFVPVFVRNGDKAGKGNAALLQHGARLWPNPHDGAELCEALAAAAAEVAAEPRQESLAFSLREQAASCAVAAETNSVEPHAPSAEAHPAPGMVAPADELFGEVRKILKHELATARTETEVVALLGVAKSQAKAWLNRLVEDGVLERIAKPKPLRYRAVSTSDRLL